MFLAVMENLYAIYKAHPQICTDSRKPIPGSIFFALSGPQFNGNRFAPAALEGGCAFAVVDDASVAIDERYIVVNNVLKALQDLALEHRRTLKAQIIGITGSNGKTTTKELLAAVLRKKYRTFATSGNLNNHIGVPLSLLSIDDTCEMAVIEMGASKPGDIKELAEIAEPDFGLITNIGKAHLEGMGGYEGVVKTKCELYDFIGRKGGKVFINSLHDVFKERSQGMDVISFGDKPSDFVCGMYVDSNPYVRFRWKRADKPVSLSDQPLLETVLMGFYNYENLLAAAAVGAYFNVSESDINIALCGYSPVNNRSQLIDTGKNLLIMDAYNANPTSMEAALLNFSEMKQASKVLVLGKMMELGPTERDEHLKLVERAQQCGASTIVFIGDIYSSLPIPNSAHVFNDVDAAHDYFQRHPITGACVLIKGSRSNKLELLRELF
ncbi:MAG: UDP-N-acetylmuramoyl-tripeptide--D-alanyl-D-alanine ligase [Bacteroidia bacterium]|jgi:UDP-N-acetylmuramoyl-tripeptide--D-alanyl-D-alanine ligase